MTRKHDNKNLNKALPEGARVVVQKTQPASSPLNSNFARWASDRKMHGARCTLEPTMRCLPLKGDPICQACHEGDVQ